MSSTLLGKPKSKMNNPAFRDHLTATITLADILDLIPWNVTIAELKIDAQGSDFSIVTSAGPALRRIWKVSAETWSKRGNEMNQSYEVPKGYLGNSLQDDWVPYMAEMGYRIIEHRGAYADETVLEVDVTWVRDEEYPGAEEQKVQQEDIAASYGHGYGRPKIT